MTRWLITGGAGFIGSHFVRRALTHASVSVTNLDALTYAGNLANLADVAKRPEYRFVRGDIADKTAVASAMADCELVVNFAAESHVDRSIASPADFVRTNLLGISVLLDEARRKDAPFLHVSTDEVYGSIAKGSFRESDRLSPSSPYSASKAGGDLLALAYRATYGLDVRITRSTNNFGPHQNPEKLIPRLIVHALAGKPLPLYGDGLNVRDWIHVADNCAAIETVIRNGRPGEIYNIGAGNETPNVEIAKRIAKNLGVSEKLIAFVPDRPGHDRRYSVVAEKIRALGWKPEADFDARLLETVRWYQQNPGWWKPLLST